jgi:hypothetical protein
MRDSHPIYLSGSPLDFFTGGNAPLFQRMLGSFCCQPAYED